IARREPRIGFGNTGTVWPRMRNWVRLAGRSDRRTIMITKFTTVYAGHVDLPDGGQNATPATERRYSNEHLASVFQKTEAIAKKMDALGFDTLWLAEHPFHHKGYAWTPHQPMWHPLRLAEDFATADILTGGRTIFGVGRGYHTREVETFGAPMLNQEANRELFEEQVEIIFKAFNEESFSHRGKNYTLPPEVPYRGYTLKELTLVPRPVRRPVECWQPIQSATPRALDFMAKHGLQGGGSAEGGAMHRVVVAWQEAHARIGQQLELGERLCFGFHFYLAPTR